MSHAELKSLPTPAPVAGIERTSHARLASTGNSCSWSFQNTRGAVGCGPAMVLN